MIEHERTFLAKSLPKDLLECKSKEILDIYLPTASHHPKLRIRMNGDKYEITKKTPVDDQDHSKLKEETTPLTKEEFEELERSVKGKRVHKRRYYLPYQGRTAEVDVFLDNLKGLVLVDVEFSEEEEHLKKQLKTPEFCLIDITQEEFIAGGMLCGKKYADIESELKKYGYKKIE